MAEGTTAISVLNISKTFKMGVGGSDLANGYTGGEEGEANGSGDCVPTKMAEHGVGDVVQVDAKVFGLCTGRVARVWKDCGFEHAQV